MSDILAARRGWSFIKLAAWWLSKSGKFSGRLDVGYKLRVIWRAL
jgi:hypothetical protein